MRFLFPLLLCAACLNSFAEETPQAELIHAELIHEVRQHLYHRQTGPAMEKAEKLLAADPENVEVRALFADAVGYRVEEIFFGMNREKTIKPEEAREAMAMISRAVKLTDDIPINAAEDVYSRALRQFGNAWSTMKAVSPGIYAEWATDLRSLQEKNAAQWFQDSRRALELAVSEKSRDDYIHLLIVFDHSAQTLPLDLVAPLYPVVFGDFLQYTRQWNRSLPPEEGWDGRLYEQFLKDLAAFVHAKEENPDDPGLKEPEAALMRTIKMLEDDDRPLFFLRGWHARQTMRHPGLGDNYKYANGSNDPIFLAAQNEMIKALREKIKSLPPETLPYMYHFLYDELSECLWRTYKPMSPESIEAQFEIYDLAFSRNDAPHIYQFWGADKTPEGAARLLAVYEKAIRLIEEQSKSGGRYEIGGSYFLHILSQHPDQLRLKAGLVEKHAPWVSFEPLLPRLEDDGKSWEYYLEPFRYGKTLFVFKAHYPTGRVKLVSANLENGETVEGPYHYIAADEKYHDETMQLRLAGGPRGYAAFADEKQVYLGSSGHGLLVFSHDGANLRRFTTKTEPAIPDDYVQGVGSLAGKIYLGLGKGDKTETRLICLDPVTGTVERLGVSLAKPDAAGLSSRAVKEFFDTENPPKFHAFVGDEKRNRLLFMVGMSAYPRKGVEGLWQIDGKTGEISKLIDLLYDEIEWTQVLPGDDELILFESWATALIDLRTNEAKILCADYYSDEANYWVVPRVNPEGDEPAVPIIDRRHHLSIVTLVDGWAWGACMTSRASNEFYRAKIGEPDNRQALKRPMNPRRPDEEEYFRYLFATHDGKGFIAANCYNVWICKVKE